MKQRLPIFAAALWWGSLCAIGFLVVPMLFANMPTPSMAGNMAAKLFSAQVWVALGSGLLLFIVLRSEAESRVKGGAQVVLALVAGGLLFALLQEYAVAPRIVARDNLKVWHSVGTAMYVAQWLCASVVLWRLAGQRPHFAAATEFSTVPADLSIRASTRQPSARDE